MRSSIRLSPVILRKTLKVLAGAVLGALVGCQSDANAQQQLLAGENALAQNQYDLALQQADTVIAQKQSNWAAEAYYLRGKALEDRPKPDAGASSSDLIAASSAYTSALASNPSANL